MDVADKIAIIQEGSEETNQQCLSARNLVGESMSHRRQTRLSTTVDDGLSYERVEILAGSDGTLNLRRYGGHGRVSEVRSYCLRSSASTTISHNRAPDSAESYADGLHVSVDSRLPMLV